VASFIGRGHELAEVQELLEQHRLVTLTGPGGSGKTRLAIAAADRVLPAFDDGVFFISLAPLRDPEMVALTTATVIGVCEVPDRPISATLADHLRSRRLLLAFDNFEHLLPAAPLVSQVLAEAPGVRVLATSRILLHLYGEREFAVPPLPLPPDGGSVAELAANPAVALFLDRAAAVSPGFHLTAENASTIGEICRRVDGLPLAIELAAARTRILSPSELAKRLEHRLAALVGGAPDVADRQRTLRGTIEWSHELLDPSQRTLFARLSIFDGGWTLDAAESVAGEGLEADVAEVLGSLVDQSLVHREPTGATPRFAMLETIREFAAEQLAAGGDGSIIAARHATYFMDLSEAAEPHLTGELVADWSNRLTRENDNLRSALRWSLATEEPGHLEIGLRLAAAAWRFWQRTGALSEAREWLDALLARAVDLPPGTHQARALIAAGGIAYWQTDYDATTSAYEEAARVAEAVGERRLMAEAFDALAYVPMLRGDLDRARQVAGRARELYLEVGDPFRAALMAANAAYLGIYTGEYADAVPPMLDAVEEARRAGERYWLINGLTGLGQLHRMMGNVEEARRYYAEALQLSLEDGNLAMVTMALDPLANLEGAAGEHDRAVRLWAASDAIKERIGGGAPEEEMLVSDPRAVAAAAIGQEAVDAAWREGRRMSPAEAVREAATLAGVDSASNLAPVSD
jgi:predicted ATPase